MTDAELIAIVTSAKRRVVVIVPGLSEQVAKAVVAARRKLGAESVQVVLDPDPEVLRLGLGEMAALTLLHESAGNFGTRIHKQQGIRIGVVITDETTVIFAPTLLLIEAGGRPGERTNAIRLKAPSLDPAGPQPWPISAI